MYGIVYRVEGREVYLTRQDGCLVVFPPDQLDRAEATASSIRAYWLIDARVVKL